MRFVGFFFKLTSKTLRDKNDIKVKIVSSKQYANSANTTNFSI